MTGKSSHSVQKHGGALATDELIGRLYGSHQHGVAPIVADLPATERANLALFCYQRAHLRHIGLAIAATCDQWSLVNAAGRAGDVLFAHSRSIPTAERAVPIGRRKITLATPAPSIRPMAGALDEDLEDDIEDVANVANAAEETLLVDA